MSDDIDIDGIRLTRYLSGDCSPDEAAEIRRWIEADPMRADLLDSLRGAWELAGGRGAEWDVDRAWDQLVAARDRRKIVPIDERTATRRPAATGRQPETSAGYATTATGRPATTTRRPATTTRRPQRIARRWGWRAAAAVILLAGGATVWSQLELELPGTEAIGRQYATERAERAELRLPDGTRVVLAPESRVRLAADFDAGDARQVYLEGQGLFEVRHEPERPFRVHSGGTVTEVLGTRFVVRAYAADSTVVVALAEGKVALRQESESDSVTPVVLAPGQLARVDVGGRTRVHSGRLEPFFLWAEGRLVFADTPLGEAVEELSRWYDLDVRLADPTLAERRLTASFGREPPERVIELIALSLNLRHVRDGRVVTFFRRE